MLERVKAVVDPWLAGRRAPAVDARPVLCLDSTRGRVDGYCFLIFDAEGSAPELVAKVARTPVARSVYQADYDNLVELERLGVNADRRTTPRPLGRWDMDGVLITLQSALDGVLMKNVPGEDLFSQERTRRTVDAVLIWWRRWHERQGVRRQAVTPEVHAREIVSVVEDFRGRFVVEPAEQALLEPLCDPRRFDGIELPWMARHGDFCTANLMLGRDGIAVFDWEFPLRHELPLFDLFYFFASTRYPFRGPRRESTHFASFEAVYWTESYLAEAMRGALADACQRFSIPTAVVPDLFLLSLLQIALMKVRWLEEAADLPPCGLLPDDDARHARWAALGPHDLDAPFARLHDGVFENLRLVARRGLPGF